MATQKIKYPRLYISAATHSKIVKHAKKIGKDMKDIGDKIAKAGLKSLGIKS